MSAVLPDTSLAAIVRDEENNPAGGIKAWLEATLPYVEQAVVVDTGSIDHTLDILEELRGKFRHLEIYQRPFDDFASSRNFSLEKVRTKKAFVMDADELLLPEEYARLRRHLEENHAIGYDFLFKLIYPDILPLDTFIHQMVLRLFDVENARFVNSPKRDHYESIHFPDAGERKVPVIPTDVAIMK